MAITISLTVAEALAILDPIQDKALTASRLAATSEGDVHEIADLSSRMLSRVATQIVDALYPPDVPQFHGQMAWPCLCAHPKAGHYFGDQIGADGFMHSWCQLDPGHCKDFRPAPVPEIRRDDLHPASGFAMSES